MGPFGLEELVEEDFNSGEKAEDNNFHPFFFVPLTTFLKKDQKFP